MRKFKVFQRRWIEVPPSRLIKNPMPLVEMVPIMTINAKTPEAALRIAKQKGQLAPIIGEAE